MVRGAVAITGMGAVTALGWGVDALVAGLWAGRVGLVPAPGGPAAPVGLVPDPEPRPVPEARALVLARAAAQEALRAAGWSPEARAEAALILATTKGPLAAMLRRLHDREAPSPGGISALAPALAAELGLAGPTLTVSVACASGLSAAGLARQLILRGDSPRALVVGVDAFTSFVHRGFDSLRALDPAGARPFDVTRAGLSVGEGAAAVTLEPGSGPVRFVGYGASNDANHITGPARDGAGLFAALDAALEEAGAPREAVGLAVLHGTGTRYNDAMEGEAYARRFGPRSVPVTSVKGAVGHLMGGAGLLNLVVAAQALLRQSCPPVAGLAEVDPALPLDVVVGAARPVSTGWGVSSASGFAGVNAAAVLAGPLAERLDAAPPASRRAVLTAAVRLPPDRADLAPRLDAKTARRLDDLCLFGLVAADAALAEAGLAPDALGALRHGLVLGTGWGCLESDAAFEAIATAAEGPPPNPRIFAYTLPNIVLGELAIRHHLRGENLVVSAGRVSGLAALAEAAARVEAGEWDAALVLAVDVPGPAAALMAAPGPVTGGVAAFVLEAEAHAAARGARRLGVVRGWLASGRPAVPDATDFRRSRSGRPLEGASAQGASDGPPERSPVGALGLDALFARLEAREEGEVHAACPTGYDVVLEVTR